MVSITVLYLFALGHQVTRVVRVLKNQTKKKTWRDVKSNLYLLTVRKVSPTRSPSTIMSLSVGFFVSFRFGRKWNEDII